MNYRSRIMGVVAALAVALLMRAPAALAADFSLQPVQPTVDTGQVIGFAGSGFTPRERVVSWATTPDQAVIGGDSTGADDAGQITFGFHVPSNAVGGRWAMTAYGLTSKTPVVAYFEVNGRAPDTTNPPVAVAPPSGSPGTTFTFAAFGYDDKEKISYWFTGPDGNVHAAYPERVKSNHDGRVDITWTSPGNALLGTWVITIQGIHSNVARALPFEIR